MRAPHALPYHQTVRVLFLDQFSEKGGAQLVLLDVIAAAQARGWSTQVALPGGGPIIAELRVRKAGVTEIPCGPYQSASKSAPDFIRFPADVRRQIGILRDLSRGGGFDLIYVNGPRVLPAAAVAFGARTPVLFHAHSRISQPSAARVARWSLRHARASVVACSRFVAEPLAIPTVQVIPNGVPDAGFHERALPADGAWRAGIIGRISPEKGQLEFVRAAGLLAADFPRASFVICGASLFAAQSYSDAVRQAARGLPVEFLGWRDDMAKVYRGLDLLVVPSRDEGMARVLVEAFSAGVPVIAFPGGGVPEVVSDNETGFLTKAATAEALAERIRDALQCKDLPRIIATARWAWEQRYTVEKFQQRITDVMAALVNQPQMDTRG